MKVELQNVVPSKLDVKWRYDQGNYMLIQSFLSADKPSVILRKMSYDDTTDSH